MINNKAMRYLKINKIVPLSMSEATRLHMKKQNGNVFMPTLKQAV